MNNIKIIMCLLVFFTFGCREDKKYSQNEKIKNQEHITNVKIDKKKDTIVNKKTVINSVKVKNQIIPDTTINRKLLLSNDKSLHNFYADYKSIVTVDKIRESPIVLFVNKFKTEYLIAYQYEGGIKNAFDCFEIGYLKNGQELNRVNNYKTIDESFRTETDISLGMTLEKLKSIKGLNYEKKEKENLTILTYRNTNFETSSFLKRYNMPSYFMEFTLKENKLEKIKFGFDYP